MIARLALNETPGLEAQAEGRQQVHGVKGCDWRSFRSAFGQGVC